MEYLWVFLALTAALVQTTRNGLMKHLKTRLGDETIMLGRFAFSAPLIALLVGGLHMAGYALPSITPTFLFYAFIAATTQILGGLLFLKILNRRNFAVGVTYVQTNAMMQAIFAVLLFGEVITLNAFLAISLSFVGIVLITIVEKHLEPKNLIQRLFTPSAIMGIGSGISFGITGVYIRQAILELDGGAFFVNASFTLCTILIMQAVLLFILVFYKNKSQLKKLFQSGYQPFVLGGLNASSSFCFFLAFSLTQAAYVSTVAQVEIIFSMFLTQKIFKEKLAFLEVVGIAIVIISIILLVLFQ